MLHEPASAPSDHPSPIPDEPKTPIDPIQEQQQLALNTVAEVLDIEQDMILEWHELPLEDRATVVQGNVDYLLTIIGDLKIESEIAYERLDKSLEEHDMTALFREKVLDGEEKHVVHILDGRMQTSKSSSPLVNIVMLILTIGSLLYIGASTAIGEIGLTDLNLAETLKNKLIAELWRGLPYTLSLMLILGGHEMAHWFMMRKYQVVASLPFFIPSFHFSPFGTFGAIIITRGAIRNRKVLFDIGVSGPLVGLIFAIPILVIGLATSPVVERSEGRIEGNSIGYAVAKVIVLGEFLPNETSDVMLNQLARAGWTGLFVTALNLIPLGQLDGGHILYSVLGNRARKLYIPILAMALGLTLFVSSIWVVLFFMLMALGKIYAVPLNDITPLDPFRRQIALLTLIIFILIFIPAPITTPDSSGGLLAGLFDDRCLAEFTRMVGLTQSSDVISPLSAC